MENRDNLYNVMTNRDSALTNIRIDPQLRREFKAAARMMGFKGMSGALHFYMVKCVSEQKERDPDTFSRLLESLEQEETKKTSGQAEIGYRAHPVPLEEARKRKPPHVGEGQRSRKK